MATRQGLTKLSTNQATEFVAQFYPVDSIFNATTGVLLVNDKQNHAPTEFSSYSLLSCSVGASQPRTAHSYPRRLGFYSNAVTKRM